MTARVQPRQRLKTSKLFDIVCNIIVTELTPRMREIVEQQSKTSPTFASLSKRRQEEEKIKDVDTLVWSFATWYLVWADLLTIFQIDVSFLWNRRTIIRWTRNVLSGETLPRDLFERLGRWDQILCSVQEREYYYTFGFLVGALTLPGTAKLAHILMAEDPARPPEPLYTTDIMGETVNCQYSLIRSFLLWFSHIGVRTSADDAVEKWYAIQKLIRDTPIPEQLLRELATVAREKYTESGLTDRPDWPMRNHLSLGAKADKPGLRGEPMLTCCTVATVSKKFMHDLATIGLNYPGVYRISKEDEPAKMIAVPKSYKTDRIILEEPVHKNWLQHTTRFVVEQFVRTCWHYTILPGRPDYNRVAVRSLFYATADLSSASDLVRQELVIACFPSWMRRILFAARSSKVRMPDGTILEIAMQSGMGNGHTFPVECHIFRCIIEWARWKFNLKWPQHLRSLPVAHVCVNGDDIIIPVEWFDYVCYALELFGFIVNSDKSWSTPSCFRESCGVDVYNGDVCTPTRLSRRFREVASAITKVAIDSSPLDDCEKENFLGLVDLGVRLLLTDHMDYTRRLVYDICRRAGARFSSTIEVIPARDAVEDHAVFSIPALYSPTGDPDVVASFDIPSPTMADPRYQTRAVVEPNGSTRLIGDKFVTSDDYALYQWALASPPRDLTSSGKAYFDADGRLIEANPMYLGITYTDYPWVSQGSYRTAYSTAVRRDFAKRIRLARKAGRPVTGKDIKLADYCNAGLPEPVTVPWLQDLRIILGL